MKMIDGTFTVNSAQDSELSDEQKNYVNSLLTDIDTTEKDSHLKLVEKVINLPIDKQLHVIYGILDNFYTLSPDSQVLDILVKQGKITIPKCKTSLESLDESLEVDEYFAKFDEILKNELDEYHNIVEELEITEEKYPELFKEVENRNRFFEKFLANTALTKFRDFVMDVVDDANNKIISKYEKKFGVKIIQSKTDIYENN
jgi:hypothetical protein